jgi:hypothetical protein
MQHDYYGEDDEQDDENMQGLYVEGLAGREGNSF